MPPRAETPPGAAPPARAHEWAGPLMALPALAGLALFIALPFAMAFGLSLTTLRLGSPLPAEFAGIEQYQRVLGDPAFRRAFLNNLVFAAVAVPMQTALALGLALLLNQPLRFIPLYRTLFFMPVVFPMALVAVIWRLLYAPGPGGPVNALVSTLSFGALGPYDYLNDPALALPAIMVLSIWQGAGFQMVVLLAGLQGIPASLYEAARIDGAGALRRFLHVTLPQLRNPLIFTALVTTVLAFRLFDQVHILTQGGPDGATATMMYVMTVAVFERQQVGRAAAMTVLFFLAVLAIALTQHFAAPQERETP